MAASLISIIGPPASGKTTLAELLAGDLGARLILEDFAGNPFLADSYKGNAAVALPAQLYFLISRIGQLSADNFRDGRSAVSDYGFCQDEIYARRILSHDDWEVYQAAAARLQKLVRPPDVIVLLDASAATLLARIAARGRDYECAMDAEFIEAMRAGNRNFATAAECPIITVDCDIVDLRQISVRKKLVDQINKFLA